MSPSVPKLPDVARSLLKSQIASLATAGLITDEQATMLIACLGLEHA